MTEHVGNPGEEQTNPRDKAIQEAEGPFRGAAEDLRGEVPDADWSADPSEIRQVHREHAAQAQQREEGAAALEAIGDEKGEEAAQQWDEENPWATPEIPEERQQREDAAEAERRRTLSYFDGTVPPGRDITDAERDSAESREYF